VLKHGELRQLTLPFVISLIGIGPTKVEAACNNATSASVQGPKLASAAGSQGGPPNDFVPSMLIEFFCSEDSKLSTPASPVRVAIASGITAQKDSVPQIAVGNGQPSKSKPDV